MKNRDAGCADNSPDRCVAARLRPRRRALLFAMNGWSVESADSVNWCPFCPKVADDLDQVVICFTCYSRESQTVFPAAQRKKNKVAELCDARRASFVAQLAAETRLGAGSLDTSRAVCLGHRTEGVLAQDRPSQVRSDKTALEQGPVIRMTLGQETLWLEFATFFFETTRLFWAVLR